jgi:hypothetical protein
LNFESSAFSRKTIRGYAIGTPVQVICISSQLGCSRLTYPIAPPSVRPSAAAASVVQMSSDTGYHYIFGPSCAPP